MKNVAKQLQKELEDLVEELEQQKKQLMHYVKATPSIRTTKLLNKKEKLAGSGIC